MSDKVTSRAATRRERSLMELSKRRVRADCPACGGDGWLEDQRPHAMHTDNRDCRACEGTGFIWIKKGER